MTSVEHKERPILFSGPMVRAILEGRKSQTRRVIKPQPDEVYKGKPIAPCNRLEDDKYGQRRRVTGQSVRCPYGQPGDRLWVRETFGISGNGYFYRADTMQPETVRYSWTPSIYMPRKASRITLEVEAVRVERLQEISDEDVLTEGVKSLNWRKYMDPVCYGARASDYRQIFECGWDEINAKRGFGWETNPWIWVVEFRNMNPESRQKCNEPRRLS